MLSVVQDKVVQDVDGSEGTGIWSQLEAVRLHVPAPTLTTAHFIRLASAYRANRKTVKHALGGAFVIDGWDKQGQGRAESLKDLQKAVYVAFLASYAEGINIIDQADKENKWNISYPTVVQIWRNGCIIRADHISALLAEIFSDPNGDRDIMHDPRIGKEFHDNFPALRRVVAKGVETDAIIPSLSATLEYLKYSTSTVLPTQFYEAQLDYFGKHMFDLKSEPDGRPVTGKHHFEWKAA